METILYYTKFIAETDHKPLKGELNIPADAFSRCHSRETESLNPIEVVCSCTEYEYNFIIENSDQFLKPSKILSEYFDEEIFEEHCLACFEKESVFLRRMN